MKRLFILHITLLVLTVSCKKPDLSDSNTYTMPAEELKHEGTWLQWPHNYTYADHITRHEETFIAMATALHTGEKVHIIAYNEDEKERIETLLTEEGLAMGQIDFFVWKTNDFWARDNGPIFTRDQNGTPVIQNWGFNGWGKKADYEDCNLIPKKIAEALNIPLVNVDLINEGGSVEIDGHGTLMAKKSSILNRNRNPGISQREAELVFEKYLGISNFIWLKGIKGGDITDDHIDGTARFANETTIVTYTEEDSDPKEYAIISEATNASGQAYNLVHLPLTVNNLPGTNDKGIYINFYIGNEVVLVPNFGDPNDAVANARIQEIYPGRTVIGIPATELGIDGGGIHCVTQQQPLF